MWRWARSIQRSSSRSVAACSSGSVTAPGSEIESAIRLVAQRRIDRAWIAEKAAGGDRGELTIARRFFANTTDAERDLIAYWQMVKLVEEAHLRYTSERKA